jgi:site-specific recombinase XerD
VNLKVEDYFQTGKRSLIRFREKGRKEAEIPVHHKLEELLEQYFETSGLRNRPNAPLFPIALGKTRKLGKRPATRIDAARLLKRRLRDAGLSDAFFPHSLRATGISEFLENGRTLEVAQRIAGHGGSSPSPTDANPYPFAVDCTRIPSIFGPAAYENIPENSPYRQLVP